MSFSRNKKSCISIRHKFKLISSGFQVDWHRWFLFSAQVGRHLRWKLCAFLIKKSFVTISEHFAGFLAVTKYLYYSVLSSSWNISKNLLMLLKWSVAEKLSFTGNFGNIFSARVLPLTGLQLDELQQLIPCQMCILWSVNRTHKDQNINCKSPWLLFNWSCNIFLSFFCQLILLGVVVRDLAVSLSFVCFKQFN